MHSTLNHIFLNHIYYKKSDKKDLNCFKKIKNFEVILSNNYMKALKNIKKNELN